MRIAVCLAAVTVLLAACGPDVAYTPTVTAADASDVAADTAALSDTAAEDAPADVSEVSAGCIVSADCPGKTEQCLSGACVPLACKPGVANCADVATVATCKADGSGWDTAGCDDGNPCTDDGCKDGGCTHANNAAKCDDGNVCTGPDVCVSGKCQPGSSVCECSDDAGCAKLADACNDAVCIATKCTQKPKAGACTDGDACTVNDVCLAGQCKGVPKDCTALDAVCITGVCAAGSCSAKFSTGSSCDDGNACTVQDTCFGPVCQGAAKDCSSLDAVCMQGVCSGGKCSAQAKTGGCDDGNPCTVSDGCSNGQCSGPAKDCNDGNACTADACQAGGCTHANADNVACDLDATNCTPDVCKSGACTKAALLDCDDKNACTTDSCIPNTGVCAHANLADSSACEDGDACTLADTCLAGACKAGAAKVCSGTEVCAVGVCKTVPDGMVLIPQGSFKMGCVPCDGVYCGYCDSNEKPQHTVTLDAFYMDVHEVTVAKYKACVDAGKCTAPYNDGASYYNWGVSGREQHPVNAVSWTQADTYCKWTDAKAHLPTEAQWEKAARGGLDDKKFPWGDADPTCTPGQANTAVWFPYELDCISGCCVGGDTWAVGTGSAKNGYGLHEMAGNVSEWVADWYGSGYYGSSPASNPTGAGSGSSRINRGGSFLSDVTYRLHASARLGNAPSYNGANVGFRCSRSIP